MKLRFKKWCFLVSSFSTIYYLGPTWPRLPCGLIACCSNALIENDKFLVELLTPKGSDA